jgi:glycosyltransferase involved in cell wall biosynthesis
VTQPFNILLPFWGRFDHFRLAVESVLAQTDGNWRLTVVDDVYPDLTPGQWLQSLGDDRIEYVRNTVNLGVSKNYLACVDRMQGEYSMLLGCDDRLLPGFLERVWHLIDEHPGVAIVLPGAEVIDADGEVVRPLVDRMKEMLRPRTDGPLVLQGENLAHSLLRGNWTYFPSLVWRVDLLRRHGFNPDLDVVQDLIMLLDITADGGVAVLDDEVQFQYRRHGNSVSSSTAVDGSRFRQERILFDAQRERFAALGWHRAASAARWHWFSRFNAVTHLPAAIAQRNGAGARALTAHALGRRFGVSPRSD